MVILLKSFQPSAFSYQQKNPIRDAETTDANGASRWLLFQLLSLTGAGLRRVEAQYAPAAGGGWKNYQRSVISFQWSAL
jgi:hypothetical protein